MGRDRVGPVFYMGIWLDYGLAMATGDPHPDLFHPGRFYQPGPGSFAQERFIPMKDQPVYMDVPGKPKISLWYAGRPGKTLDQTGDQVIQALEIDSDWYDRALLKLDIQECRVVIIRYISKFSPPIIQKVRFSPLDMHDFSQVLAKMKSDMLQQIQERFGGAL